MQLNLVKLNEIKFGEIKRFIIPYQTTLQTQRGQTRAFTPTAAQTKRTQVLQAVSQFATVRVSLKLSQQQFQTARELISSLNISLSTLRLTTHPSTSTYQTSRRNVLYSDLISQQLRECIAARQVSFQSLRSVFGEETVSLSTIRRVGISQLLLLQTLRRVRIEGVEVVKVLDTSRGTARALEASRQTRRSTSVVFEKALQAFRNVSVHETDLLQTRRETTGQLQPILGTFVRCGSFKHYTDQTARVTIKRPEGTSQCKRILVIPSAITYQTLTSTVLYSTLPLSTARYVYGIPLAPALQTLRRVRDSEGEDFEATLQTGAEIVTYIDHQCSTVRATMQEMLYTFQTLSQTVLQYPVVLDTVVVTLKQLGSVLTQLRRTTQQIGRALSTRRTNQIGYNRMSQTAREVVFLHVKVLNARRSPFAHRSYILQELRKVQLTWLGTLQGHRSVYRLHLWIRDYLAQLSFNALEFKFLGTVTILQSGIDLNLQPIIMFPGEKRLFSFRVKNLSGRDIRNLQVQHLAHEDNESQIQAHLFGYVDDKLTPDLIRVSIGLKPDQLKKVAYNEEIVLKPGILKNGEEMLVYLEVQQPDDLIPITHLDLAFIYKMESQA